MTVIHAPPETPPGNRSRRRARARQRPADLRSGRTGRRAWFRRRRLAGRLGLVGVTRLLMFQLALVGVVVMVVRGTWPAVVAAIAGSIAVAVTFGRWRGRWWTELVALRLRHRRQRTAAGDPITTTAAAPSSGATGGAGATTGRGQPAPGGTDPRLVALGGLVSDLAVESVPGTDAWPRWGIGSDGAGWFAVLEVDTTDAGVHPPMPMAALAEAAAEAEQPGVVIQVVSHNAHRHEGPSRTLWIVVRLDSFTVADSLVDNADQQPDVPAVLAEISRRVARILRRRRMQTRVLDVDGVLDALLQSCALAPDRGPSREWWRWWDSGRLAHRTFWLRAWPDPEAGTTLLASLSDLPTTDGRAPLPSSPGNGNDVGGGSEVSISFVLEPRRAGEGIDLRCLVRLAAPMPQLPSLCHQAESLADRLGAVLFPLDGEQALATYGSAPTGGGAR